MLCPVHYVSELRHAVDIAVAPAFDKLLHILAPGPAQEIQTHLLKITRQACNQQPVPGIGRIDPGRGHLRPVEAQLATKLGKGCRHIQSINLPAMGEISTAGGTVIFVDIGDLVSDFGRCACFNQRFHLLGRLQAAKQMKSLVEAGATPEIANKIANIYKNDGAAGSAYLAHSREIDALDVAAAFTQLGSQLGLDWAQMTATRINPSDPWDRLLVAGLARDFQQMRLDFLRRTRGKDMQQFVESWGDRNIDRVAQFRNIMDRAQQTPKPSIAMLAQIAGQARLLLSR